MRICIAQTKPIKGDIQANIEIHKNIINIAVSNKSDIIVFPELSLTGYEPELAKDLATNKDDSRFDEFQEISNKNNITIGVGIPVKSTDGVLISMLIFQPNKPRTLYSKQHLHPGEADLFTVGNNQIFLEEGNNKIALAICYETSVLEHSEYANSQGANIYIASVLNSIDSIHKDIDRISKTARKYKMTAFMSNYVGMSGGNACVGKSSVWNNQGDLVAQLDDETQGILIYDTLTEEIVKRDKL
ncbi:carbon-nitrogen hydrolase family protein [Flavivirga eckloniae]|uniref:Carbon-nitrogen hydrolase family protein n=1 Tax=Flavivirga eckloniae TaxID=1803846 RepID=A0A2K9PNX6_9FLAO|nr:carbon-nitrogen hydrolase family protein [Flavivirga eckloniae]AUP78752.1 carbon-nitrogen hydrolase family protein [Flavivirga eckloniae]